MNFSVYCLSSWRSAKYHFRLICEQRFFIFAKTFINTNNERLDGFHPRCLKELKEALGTSFFLILMPFPQLTNYRMNRCNTAAHMYSKGRNPFLCMMSFRKTVLGVAGGILNGPVSQ